MTDSPHTADIVERVARALYHAAQLEAIKLGAPKDVPDFDTDDDESRRFCRSMAEAAIAALQGSAALPSEAGDRLGPSELYGAVGVAMFKADLGGLRIDHKINFVGNAAYTAMTDHPTAPVQDDDAVLERARGIYEQDVKRGDNTSTLLTYDLGRLLSRLSPTPDTGLIEALRRLIALHDDFMTTNDGFMGNQADAYYCIAKQFAEWDNARTALANAAPAQVESGK